MLPGTHHTASKSDYGSREAEGCMEVAMDKRHELRSFLGVCTYCQTLTAGYVDIAKPLTQLTEVEFSVVSRGTNLLVPEGVTVCYPS
jgi:hypothetical protein